MTPLPLHAGDLDAIDGLRPADWPPYRATFERYFALPCCFPYGFAREGRLEAMGTLIVFGRTGWIAQLITHPRVQGQGLGSLMLAFLKEEAVRRGITTLSLVATDQGYPLYLKAGFRVEGQYLFWARKTAAPAEPGASEGLSAWTPARSQALAALDREASGEGRSPYWEGKTASGFTVGKEGFFLPGVGEGLVVARSEGAGVPLLHRRIDGAERVVVPEENQAAGEVLTARGFSEVKTARRMVLGQGLDRKPQWVWSRIGGNLG